MKRWHKALAALVLGLLFISVAITKTKNRSDAVPHLPTPGAPSDDKGHEQSCRADVDVSLEWHPPSKTEVNDLRNVIDGKGVYGFIFNSSAGPHNTYNYCNMPRVHPDTYPAAKDGYKLEYVEVIHRHHKRTPYATNAFPVEGDTWFCDDERLFFGGEPTPGTGSAKTHWRVYASDSNPLTPMGFVGTCQYPQITGDGLIDSRQHGTDIKKVYQGMLHFLPEKFDRDTITYRVTNNIITSQVASQAIVGMWPGHTNLDHDLLIQQSSIDSLEPAYACNAAKKLYGSYGPGSSSNNWTTHLSQSAPLKKRLDKLSGVKSSASDWSNSWDHYFDNLSTRLCHQKELPCNIEDPSDCVTMEEAEKVFRLGEYEYSFIYRDSEKSLRASIASYGIWVGELVHNLRIRIAELEAVTEVSAESASVRYRHNFAHDGSVARLLSILQADQMVWPGMGAEVVFELFSENSGMGGGARCYYLRVLWGGQILRSSHPAFDLMDMVPVDTFFAYADGLVGVRGSKIPNMCRGTL